jgi:hypothetical protein
MTELKKIERLWSSLTPIQTLLIALRARWFLLTNAYAQSPYALRRRLFNRVLYQFIPAHWVR